MTTKTQAPDLTALDAQIAVAEAEHDAAQFRWKHRPMVGMRIGGSNGPLQIDHEGRARTLDLGLDVDRAIIRVEELKRERAVQRLAQLDDPKAAAAEEAARQEARAAIVRAEAALAEAKQAWSRANGRRQQRQDRMETMRSEIARADGVLAGARNALVREQAERDALHVA